MVEKANQNKGLFLGIAAASALVGAALLYHFVFNEAEEEETATIVDELAAQKLDVVKKAPNGNMLDPEYMVKLLNCITTSAKKRREGERNTALAARRELYKSESWDAYRENVQEQFMKENTMSETVMREALEHLQIQEQTFQMTMQMMAQNPQYMQMIMAAQQGKLPTEEALAEAKRRPKLEKSKTLKAFQESKALTMDAMKRAQTNMKKPQGQQDEMTMMIDMFVDQAKVEDALFIKEGVTSEEVEESIMYFMGTEDADVKKAMMAYMMEMQQMQGGGGMPGMGM